MRRAVIVLGLVAFGGTARADTAATHRRERHGGFVLGGAAVYLLFEAGIKGSVAPDHCRWCDPPGFDASARDAIKWDDTHLANTLSNITGFYTPPVYTLGMLLLAEGSARSGGRFLDDALPVLESGVVMALLHHAVKFTVGRERPFVHYAPVGSRSHQNDDDVSFFSGHTSTSFAIAAAAGEVAHERGYRLAPVIWGGGFALAATTGYLRMAADKHYLSDVTVGALVGTAVGLAWPRLFDRYLRDRDIAVMPAASTVTIAGRF
jgi:membrane-associated phospholipid phosphatase